MKRVLTLWVLLAVALAGCSVQPPQEPEDAEPEPTSRVVNSLADQAREQYHAGNHRGAIATAERGLRIDRRAGELYLLMAQSYLALSMPARADQFAAQGLRHAPAGSELAGALSQLRAALADSSL